MKSKIIAVDFDGTLCENEWPNIGRTNHEVIKYLKTEQQNGDRLILWTCRTGDKLTDAINWCADHGLKFDAVNQNVKEAIDEFGEDTRKVFANEYIDDKSSHQFDLPFTKREMGITDEVIRTLELVFGFPIDDQDLKSIENFVTKDNSVMEFKEMQAVVKMQYEIYKRIYKRMMQPTYIINTYKDGGR